MKQIIIFVLTLLFFLSCVLGVAVSPVTIDGGDEFIVINNLDRNVDYVVKGDFVCEPQAFSLSKGERQVVKVYGSGVGEIVVYELLGEDLGFVNGVALNVDRNLDNRLTGDAVLDYSDFGNTRKYSLLILVGIVVIIFGVVGFKNYEWILARFKNRNLKSIENGISNDS